MTMHFNLPLTQALYEIIAEQKRNKKFIIWTHDLTFASRRYTQWRKDIWPWNLLSSKIPGADYVTISQWRQRRSSKVLGVSLEDISYIPNGVDPDRFTADTKKESLRALTERLQKRFKK